MKKYLALALALILAIAVVGCKKTAEAPKEDSKTVVEIVVAGSFGDRSFYDS